MPFSLEFSVLFSSSFLISPNFLLNSPTVPSCHIIWSSSLLHSLSCITHPSSLMKWL
uniref:Uncharacterized protein n=1 Tax=Rhizophora mucronata TaxID=61149 RepID=A0A2P2P9V9_RHIMU